MELAYASTLFTLWVLACVYWLRDKSENATQILEPDVKAPVSVLLVYASQSGQARDLVQRYTEQFNISSTHARACAIDQVQPHELSQFQQVLFVVSTYGDGAAPDHAQRFERSLKKLAREQHIHDAFEYAVLALGDSSYTNFCAFGHRLDQLLQKIGGHPMWPCHEVDCMAKGALNSWQKNLHSRFQLAPIEIEQTQPYQLIDRRHLNPQSPHPSLHLLRLRGLTTTSESIADGSIIDIRIPDGTTRSYSLANAPVSDRNGAVTVDLIVREHFREDGTPGMGSYWLTQRIDGGSQIFLTARQGVDWQRIPSHAPLIVIAAGSGLAGARGALQARFEAKASGPHWFIFGERDAEFDCPLQNEICQWHVQHQLTHLNFVWSRNNQHKSSKQRGYVQDVLLQEQQRLRNYLMQGAYLYICGSATGLGESVDMVLHDLLGEAVMQGLKLQNRYLRDIY